MFIKEYRDSQAEETLQQVASLESMVSCTWLSIPSVLQ